MYAMGFSFDGRTLAAVAVAVLATYLLTRWLQGDKVIYTSLVGPRKDELPSEDDGLEDADVEQMQAWSITARLAHIQPADMAVMPEAVAALIAEAKSLHPKVAEGALHGSY